MWEVDPNGSSFARSFGSLPGFGGFWGLGFWLGWSGKHVVLRGGSRKEAWTAGWLMVIGRTTIVNLYAPY